MPLFSIEKNKLESIQRKDFGLEKDLQSLIEKNLDVVFNCRFVASEFATGPVHAGRIDTLALSEDNNPVIIEYKKVESSSLINQSLFYLSWIQDHRGDFEIAAQRTLGNNVDIDWSDTRVICIAPNYKKYDLHAVQVMGANIELWSYKFFKNKTLYLEEVFRKSLATTSEELDSGKNPVMVAAGKKAAQTRATAVYTVEERFEGKPEKIKELFYEIQDFVTGLDASIEEVPKKFYVAYKISQNIVCVDVRKGHLFLFVKLNPAELSDLPDIARDVSEIGHYGTGDLELKISSTADIEVAKPFIEMAYQKVGG
jgi:predicted transport protein